MTRMHTYRMYQADIDSGFELVERCEQDAIKAFTGSDWNTIYGPVTAELVTPQMRLVELKQEAQEQREVIDSLKADLDYWKAIAATLELAHRNVTHQRDTLSKVLDEIRGVAFDAVTGRRY